MRHIVALIFQIVCVPGLFSQTITGVITDEAALPVENARITLFNVDTTLFIETRTDAEGRYKVSSFPEPGLYLFFGVAARGKEYFQNVTPGILDTIFWDAILSPETHRGEWTIIMDSPEPLGGTDLGVLLADGTLYYCHNTKDPFFFDPSVNDTIWAQGHEQNQGCVAPALLEDGSVLFAGGTLQKIYGPGTNKVKSFDPSTEEWKYRADLLDYRWYPTLAPLYDGRYLIIGGGGLNNPQRVKTSEIYDPQSEENFLVDTIHFGNEVSPIVPLYNGKILMTHRPPQLFDPGTMQWEFSSDFVQSNRLPNGDHSDHELVLLPDGQVLAVGYKSFTPGEPGVTLEIYDPATDQWSLRSHFAPTRSRAKTVLLPDAKVLVMGGQKEDLNDPSSVNNWGYMNLTDLYNPLEDSWRRLAPMNVHREYHAITALVADGRVIAVGGEGAPGNEPPESIIEGFSPPYLFRGVRPVISNLNATSFYRGEQIAFDVARTNELTQVLLISNPVLTHFMNSGNNRFLDLNFTQNGNRVVAMLPSDSIKLIPGWYMLFGMVDDIPSVASIIQIKKGTSTVGLKRFDPVPLVILYPNPSSGLIYLQCPSCAVGKTYKIELYEADGQTIHTEQIRITPGESVKLDLPSDIQSGIYFLLMKNERDQFYQKVLIIN